jgi:chromosome segregation ATPase
MDSKIEMARRIVNSNSNYEQGLERGQINFTAQEVMKIALAAIEECTEAQSSMQARIDELEDDVALWKREAADRSQGMVDLNLDRAAMGVENMQLRERIDELEAENERLTKAVGSGILGQLLNDEETDEFVKFIKFLRGSPEARATLSNTPGGQHE